MTKHQQCNHEFIETERKQFDDAKIKHEKVAFGCSKCDTIKTFEVYDFWWKLHIRNNDYAFSSEQLENELLTSEKAQTIYDLEWKKLEWQLQKEMSGKHG